MLEHIGSRGDHIIVIVAGTFALLVMSISISYSAAAAWHTCFVGGVNRLVKHLNTDMHGFVEGLMVKNKRFWHCGVLANSNFQCGAAHIISVSREIGRSGPPFHAENVV